MKRATLSVMKTLHPPETSSKRHAHDGPRQMAARLRPWLDLANEVIRNEKTRREVSTFKQQREADAPPLLTFVRATPDTPWFPAKQILGWFSHPMTDARARRLLREARRLSGPERLLALARKVKQVLRFYADESEEPFPFLSVPVGHPDGFLFTRGENNRPVMDPFDPFRDYFWPVFAGATVDRIGRCPNCELFFYRLKKTGRFGTKACSKLCNNVRRNQLFRQKEEERISRVVEMLREGKGVQKIARALESASSKPVTPTRVRCYVRKAKERKRKGA
jgi:hypothetical protein